MGPSCGNLRLSAISPPSTASRCTQSCRADRARSWARWASMIPRTSPASFGATLKWIGSVTWPSCAGLRSASTSGACGLVLIWFSGSRPPRPKHAGANPELTGEPGAVKQDADQCHEKNNRECHTRLNPRCVPGEPDLVVLRVRAAPSRTSCEMQDPCEAGRAKLRPLSVHPTAFIVPMTVPRSASVCATAWKAQCRGSAPLALA